MSSAALFAFVGSGLVGLGLCGLILREDLLRRIVSFSILGNGVFLLFGVVARRGSSAGIAADPVPQAMVITGIVVAFAATALAVALLRRLEQQREAEDAAASSDGPSG